MSVTVEFKNKDDNSGNLSVVITYNYGDFVYSALHITCVSEARRLAERYRNILEKQRLSTKQF